MDNCNKRMNKYLEKAPHDDEGCLKVGIPLCKYLDKEGNIKPTRLTPLNLINNNDKNRATLKELNIKEVEVRNDCTIIVTSRCPLCNEYLLLDIYHNNKTRGIETQCYCKEHGYFNHHINDNGSVIIDC